MLLHNMFWIHFWYKRMKNISKMRPNCLPLVLMPNSIFISTRTQSWVDQYFSRISNTVWVDLFMISISLWPISRPFEVNLADIICSSDHWGSLLASSWKRKNSKDYGVKLNSQIFQLFFIFDTSLCLPNKFNFKELIFLGKLLDILRN